MKNKLNNTSTKGPCHEYAPCHGVIEKALYEEGNCPFLFPGFGEGCKRLGHSFNRRLGLVSLTSRPRQIHQHTTIQAISPRSQGRKVKVSWNLSLFKWEPVFRLSGRLIPWESRLLAFSHPPSKTLTSFWNVLVPDNQLFKTENNIVLRM